MIFFFSSRRRHTRCSRDWSSDVCSSDLIPALLSFRWPLAMWNYFFAPSASYVAKPGHDAAWNRGAYLVQRSEEHTSELQSRLHLVCRLLLEKKKEHLNHLLPTLHPVPAV